MNDTVERLKRIMEQRRLMADNVRHWPEARGKVEAEIYALQGILDSIQGSDGPEPGHALAAWWVAEARTEADKLVPKAEEYGSYDLRLIGDVLAHVGVQGPGSNMETGIVFYLLGKIARVASALKDEHPPADDTYRDIAIYARMVLYIRAHGRWP